MQIRQKATKILSIIFILLFAAGISIITPLEAHALSWSQANTDGFGAAANWGTIRLHTFKSYMYAGGGNDLGGAQMYRSSDGTTWNPITTDGFGDTNNNEFHAFTNTASVFASTLNSVTGAEVWSSATGDAGTWTQKGSDGLGDANNTGIRAMTTFGSYVYAATENTLTGTEIWRTQDGTSWTQVNTDGFGSVSNVDTRALKASGGYLYAGVENNASGAKIFRTSNGTDWTEVSTGGFGDANNNTITFLEYFSGSLYAGTINTVTGAELWRSQTGDSGSWTQANTDGFGDSANTWVSYQGAVVNNVFWLGTRTSSGGARLYYSTNGTTWTQEGSNGFGDANNYAIYAVNFQQRLYVGFSNGSTGTEIWRSGPMDLIALSPESLPAGTVGQPYSTTTIQAVNGSAPYILFCAPEIPPGSEIYLEVFQGGVQAQYKSQHAVKSMDIGNGSCNMPPGMSFSSSGVISGTPSQQGNYSFSVFVVDSGTPYQYTYRNYTINVSVPVGTTLPETGSDRGSWLWVIGGLTCLESIYLTQRRSKKRAKKIKR